jgi:hypothetical protein
MTIKKQTVKYVGKENAYSDDYVWPKKINYKALKKLQKDGLTLEFAINNRPGSEIISLLKKFDFINVEIDHDSIDTIYGIIPKDYSKEQVFSFFRYLLNHIMYADENSITRGGSFRFWWD